jgi:hypothetical protein
MGGGWSLPTIRRSSRASHHHLRQTRHLPGLPDPPPRGLRYVSNIADSAAIVSESGSSNTPGQSLVYSLPPRTFGLN